MRLIDADALREDWLENGQNEYVYDTNAFLESIDEAPTIEAEPVRHGEWEPVLDSVRNLPTPVLSGWRCSECGRRIDIHKEPYCNCGAKMDGGKNE